MYVGSTIDDSYSAKKEKKKPLMIAFSLDFTLVFTLVVGLLG